MELTYILFGVGIVVIPTLLWIVGYSFLRVRLLAERFIEQDRYHRSSIDNLSNHINSRYDRLSNEMHDNLRMIHNEFSRKHEELVKDRTEALKNVYTDLNYLSDRLKTDISNEVNNIYSRLNDVDEEPESFSSREHQLYS